ncbi:hypothetical protein D3C85_1139110 [compost metagenome]
MLVRHDAVAGHFQHGQGVQRDVRARPGVRGRGQVVGVGFAGDLEYGQGVLVGNRRLAGEPLGVGPGLQYGLGVEVAGAGFFGHVVEGIEHQQGVLELFGGNCCQLGIVQQVDQSDDVVTTEHGAQQLDRALFVEQWRVGFTLGHGREETGLDVGGFVYTGWDAVGDQVGDEGFFAGRRLLQQLDQACGLFGVQRQGRKPFFGACLYMADIGFKHGVSPLITANKKQEQLSEVEGDRPYCQIKLLPPKRQAIFELLSTHCRYGGEI